MTTPRSPGWYDDPHASNAERWWDGQEWTPQRRPKVSMPAPQTQPVKRPRSNAPSNPGQSGQFVPRQSLRPAEPYPATAFNAQRLQYTLAALIGLTGVGLIVAALLRWGRARATGTDVDAVISATVSFPGMGAPTVSGTYSDTNGAGHASLDVSSLHNTNLGWVALACGILAIVVAAGYARTRYRRELAIAAAVVGVVSAVFCINDVVDVRGALNDPPDLVNFDFSVGMGLVAACVLSLVLAALGTSAFIVEWRGTSVELGRRW